MLALLSNNALHELCGLAVVLIISNQYAPAGSLVGLHRQTAIVCVWRYYLDNSVQNSPRVALSGQVIDNARFVVQDVIN